jgi:amino acid transporter
MLFGLIKKIFFITIFFIVICAFCFNDVKAAFFEGDLVDEIDDQEVSLVASAGITYGLKLGEIVAIIIKGFLSLLGVIFMILILIGGFNWMTASGDEEKVRKAKDTLRRAIIGLLIVVSAYAITYFVFKYLPWEGGGGPPAS